MCITKCLGWGTKNQFGPWCIYAAHRPPLSRLLVLIHKVFEWTQDNGQEPPVRPLLSAVNVHWYHLFGFGYIREIILSQFATFLLKQESWTEQTTAGDLALSLSMPQ